MVQTGTPQVKLNVDASFHVDYCAGSTGVVIRDYQGNFMAATTVYLPHVASLAIAMHECLFLRTDWVVFLLNRIPWK